MHFQPGHTTPTRHDRGMTETVITVQGSFESFHTRAVDARSVAG